MQMLNECSAVKGQDTVFPQSLLRDIDRSRALLRRKYDDQLTDLQALILLDLARVHLATLTDLASGLRFALNSVSAACMVLEGRGLLKKHWKERPYRKAPYSLVYIHLTSDGAAYVRKLAEK